MPISAASDRQKGGPVTLAAHAAASLRLADFLAGRDPALDAAIHAR